MEFTGPKHFVITRVHCTIMGKPVIRTSSGEKRKCFSNQCYSNLLKLYWDIH